MILTRNKFCQFSNAEFVILGYFSSNCDGQEILGKKWDAGKKSNKEIAKNRLEKLRMSNTCWQTNWFLKKSRGGKDINAFNEKYGQIYLYQPMKNLIKTGCLTKMVFKFLQGRNFFRNNLEQKDKAGYYFRKLGQEKYNLSPGTAIYRMDCSNITTNLYLKRVLIFQATKHLSKNLYVPVYLVQH